MKLLLGALAFLAIGGCATPKCTFTFCTQEDGNLVCISSPIACPPTTPNVPMREEL